MNTKKQDLKDPPVPKTGMNQALEGVFSEFVFDHPLLKNATVYPHLHATASDWEQTTFQEALPYLPLQQQEPINVTLGIQSLTTLALPVFETVPLDKYLKYKRGYVINTGGAIHALDFAPKTSSKDTQPMIHYLAIGGYKQPNVLHSFETPRQGQQSYIQLWKCDLTTTPSTEERKPLLDLVLLHDFGDARELKWCPYGAYEEELTTDDHSAVPKLGILAGCFDDGTVRCLVVPHPESLRNRLGQDSGNQDPIYLKIKHARCVFALPNASLSTLSWGGHKKLAIGSSTGDISIWNMEMALTTEHETHARDQHRSVIFMQSNTPVHDAGVQSIVWHGIEDPVNFVSTSNDGKLNALDIRDPSVPINLAKTRVIQYDAIWAGYRNKVMFVDGDLNFKEFSPQDCKGFKSSNVISFVTGPFASIASSEQHSFLALSSLDGILKLINSYIAKIKGKSRQQKIVYKLIYYEQGNIYRYVDGLKRQTLDETKAMSPANNLQGYNTSINKVCWNHNSKTSAWIATGGSNGLCRLDFAGVGNQWD